MAWLMLQKAVAAGELSTEESDAQPAASLAALNDSGDDVNNAALERLPLAARGLIDRARHITALVEQLSSKTSQAGPSEALDSRD